MGFNSVSFNAAAFMKSGEYFNRSGKREGEYRDAEQGGHYQDEIVKLGDESIWFYHGHPIASYNHVTKEWKRSSCGWKTMTTKARLNTLFDKEANLGYIWKKKFEWYVGGELFDDADIRPAYHRIDGWHGYELSPFAVAGVSNTGGWSDSPARPEDGEREIGMLSAFLAEKGIKTYKTWKVTSNVFCIKVFLNVKGKDWEKAKPIADQWLSEHDRETRLIHGVW